MQPDADFPTGQEVTLGPVDTRPTPMPGANPMIPYFKARGVDPANATPEQWKQALADKQANDVAVASGKVKGGINAKKNAGVLETDEYKTAKANYQASRKSRASAANVKAIKSNLFAQQLNSPGGFKLPTSADINAEVARQQKEDDDKWNQYDTNYRKKASLPAPTMKNYNMETGEFEPALSDEDDE